MASRHNEVVKQDRAQADLRVARALLDEKTAQLLAKTEQLLTMLGSISQGILMIGEDGRLNTFNARVCELLDLPESYLRSRPTLAEMGGYQMERGDFGSDVAWVAPNARDYVATSGEAPMPDLYLRTRRDGRVLEIKTQRLASGGLVRTFTDVTDYVQAEQARRRSNALLQAAQALAGVGGMDIDLLTGSVYWTDEVYRLLDTTPAEFSPTAVNAFDFFAPEWVPIVKAAIRNAEMNVGLNPPALEAEMITAKGRRIWVRARSTLTLVDGQAVKRTSVIQDITAQKQSEASLRASEELLRQITSQVPGMVYRLLIAPDGVRSYSFVSPGVRELYGVTPEAVLADGHLLQSLRHPGDRPQFALEMDTVIRQGQPLTSEFRIMLRNGTQKWVQMTSAAVRVDAEGTVRNGVMIDITARKQAETALRERDDLWKLALESTGDGVWDWYVQTGVELFSRRCLEMYGFTEGELADSPDELDRRTHPDDVDQMRRDRDAHFDGLTPTYTNEHRIRCKDGSWKWIMSRGMVISRDEQGRPLRMTGTHTDITARKNTEALIWKQANFDALTGLPNRRKLRHQLAKDLISSRNAGLQLALLFIDLDHFKEVNDTLGHDQGDALLVQAAQRIRQCVRDHDTVARMGGDEFTVVLPALGQLERVEQVVQRIIDALATAFQLGEEQAFVSASIGITLYPDDALEIDNLFKHADQALYVAKDNGRNCFSYYTPALQEAAQTRVRLANDLRNALAEEQLWVAYQPIVELATGVTHKAEALVRWQHPTRGLVSPAQFIPIAETSGLIIDIGEWVFRQAAHQVGEWRQRHHPGFQISVNKSPLQFHNRKESHLVWFDYLQALGLPGQSIALEITEGLLLDASAAVNGQLLAFRDAGIAVALDDFGTGYSSLSYLQQYDIDYLKIDQSFVRGLATGSKDLALCKAIIVMAHELGMKVIAEGVETPAQRDLLLAAGCDYGQGYLFARPMPAGEFGAFLAGEQT